MADRIFRGELRSLEEEPCELLMKVDFGASGAPTIVTNRGKGIASIARTGAGAYTVTLEDRYMALLGISVTNGHSAAQDLVWMEKDDVTNLSNKVIGLLALAAAVATDPANGSSAYFRFTLKNSSLP